MALVKCIDLLSQSSKYQMARNFLPFVCFFILFSMASCSFMIPDPTQTVPMLCLMPDMSFVPAGIDPATSVQSKDVTIAEETGVSARLYLPKAANGTASKLPLLVYFHGGGFCIGSAFSIIYHTYCNSLSNQANVVILSVNYRLAPENPLPAAYDDSWAALQWAASENDEWLKDIVDFGRVFLGGDSAGGNIAHNVALRLGLEKLDGINLVGMVLTHPFFWSAQRIPGEEGISKTWIDEPAKLWTYVFPPLPSLDDPRLNPAKDPNLSSLPCGKVLVCYAGLDMLRFQDQHYASSLNSSGWKGKVDTLESPGEQHVFFLRANLINPVSKQHAQELMERVVSFLNDNSSQEQSLTHRMPYAK